MVVVWENFKKLVDFYPNRTCWERCHKCKKDWFESETENVHMVRLEEKGNMYICDNCLVESKK